MSHVLQEVSLLDEIDHGGGSLLLPASHGVDLVLLALVDALEVGQLLFHLLPVFFLLFIYCLLVYHLVVQPQVQLLLLINHLPQPQNFVLLVVNLLRRLHHQLLRRCRRESGLLTCISVQNLSCKQVLALDSQTFD